jgi:amidase
MADGADDVQSHLALSGEPLVPEIAGDFQPRAPLPLLEYQKLTLEGLEYEAAYSDYWNSTAADDGQIVDAVIMPVAPHAAVIPGQYHHVRMCLDGHAQVAEGAAADLLRSTDYTEAINLLNYSAAVIPVTKADKSLDAFDSSYQPLNPVDKLNWESCMLPTILLAFFTLTHASSRRSRTLPWCPRRRAARRPEV